MKKIGIFLVFGILLVSTLSNSQALQEVAGPVVFQMQPGKTETLQWGLVSDDNTPITLTLSASGAGSELLSFPSTVTLAPHQYVQVNVTVTVPADQPNNVRFTPSVYATEAGATGGPTVINVRVEKVLTINIGNPPIEATPPPPPPPAPQQPSTQAQSPSTQSPRSTTIVASPSSTTVASSNTSGSTTSSGSQGGGCLIATAAYGSEMAPQVQQLRETRDNIVMKTQSGAEFMTGFNVFYYSFAPTVADWERENSAFKDMVRVSITPLLTTLAILNYVPIHSEGQMLFYGIGIILLNVGMYFIAPIIVITKLRHKILKIRHI